MGTMVLQLLYKLFARKKEVENKDKDKNVL